MQTAAGGEFLSPSGNISCEVDYHQAGLTQVYCQTVTPAQSVTMSITGGYKADPGHSKGKGIGQTLRATSEAG